MSCFDPMVQRVHKAATETMALLGLPAAVLDAAGTVLMANRLLEEAAFGLQLLPDGRIALESPKSQRLLRLAIAELAQPASPGICSIPVAATPAHGACIVHLIPAAGSVHDGQGGYHALLVVTPLSIGSTPVPALEGLFDFTPAEARVARRIALGHTMERIALDFDVSRETVRTHMKAIFSKTGMNKQAQVAALVAGLPRIPLCAAQAR